MDEFCKDLPKIELHAHLNGSLSKETLKQLGCLKDSVDEYNKLSKILDKDKGSRTLDDCFQLFNVAHRATASIENVYKACTSVISDFADDNVLYLELRTTPRSENNMTKVEYIDAVIRAVLESTRNVIVKLIFSINRCHDPKESADTMNVIINKFRTFPDLIKGVELSGNPNGGQFDPIIFETARNAGLKISLHCAEVKNDDEVVKMLKFKPHRLGHGTCLHQDYGGSENIWNVYLDQPIPVEICLTSNVLCGTTENYEKHHVQEWVRNKLPYCLGTDDKGIFCTTLTEEFYLASNYFNLSKNDLWQLNFNAVDYTFASDAEKAHLRQLLIAWKSNM